MLAKNAHVAPAKSKPVNKANFPKKEPKAAKQAAVTRDGSKTACVLALLKRTEGVTLPELMKAKVQISTLNADLVTLRRIFHLAIEWGRVTTVLPRVRMLPGENRRERVLTPKEAQLYLVAATEAGHQLSNAYREALQGIRSLKRGQAPRKPDAYRLRDAATVLIDTGLRPDECFRMKWADNIRDGAIEIHAGKGRGSRRRIPASQRVLSILECGGPQERPSGSSLLQRRVVTLKRPLSKSSTRQL